MEDKFINNIEVTVTGAIGDDELSEYLGQLQAKQIHKIIAANVVVDGEYVDVQYKVSKVPFERIRRITGYLVGTTERWNNGKQAELKDRVKHN